MMRALFTVAVFVACLAVAGQAHATTVTDQGVPNTVIAPGTLGPCAVFQVLNLNQTFAVLTSDANYEDEFALVSLAEALQVPLTFVDPGSTVSNCQSYELAQNIQLGNTQCATGYTFDFSQACDVVAVWNH